MPSIHESTTTLKALRCALAALAIFAMTGIIRANEARDPDYDALIDSAKHNLEAGKTDVAQAELQQAVMQAPEHYEGHFYLAVAEFRMGNPTNALENAQAAVANAKGDNKKRAQELLNEIRKTSEAPELERQANEARGKGLNAKAAELYARAFALLPERGDLGLNAATLYGNRLGRLLDAAVLYQGVIASGDAAAATSAGAELGALHEPLEKLYDEALPRAVENRDRETLKKLSKGFPHEWQPPLEVAVLHATDNASSTIEWLGEAVRLGADYDQVKARSVFLELWERDGRDFKTFIGDAFGPEAASDMDRRSKALLAKVAEERRVAAEKVRAEQLAREKRLKDEADARERRLRNEQLAREKNEREEASRPLRAQLRTPVAAELNQLLQAGPEKKIGTKAGAKFLGGSEKSWSEYHAQFALRGDAYVLESTHIFEFWKTPANKMTTKKTFSIPSLSSLNQATVTRVYTDSEKILVGPYQSIFVITLEFNEAAVTVTVQESGVVQTPERTNMAYAWFLAKDPADATRAAALIKRLKEIDSMPLERLREEAGAL